jgi:lipopolysaccharide/colanic/teichoic acid biosynthesis glycosyltransferase
VTTTAVDRDELAAPEADRAGWGLDFVCRGIDLFLGVLLLLVFLPVMIVLALVIRLDSSGPVLFRQTRLGRSLKPFTIHKFRTMRNGVSHDIHRTFVLGLIAGEQPASAGEQKPAFKLSSDQRVTRVGRILRRTSLDELPQLWNVVRGDMSLVGPRPPIQYEVDHYPPHWFARFAVKPGVTGLWQVSGRSQVTLEEMIRLDIEYTRRRSPWLNLRIIARTIPAVLSGRGAS